MTVPTVNELIAVLSDLTPEERELPVHFQFSRGGIMVSVHPTYCGTAGAHVGVYSQESRQGIETKVW